MYSGFRGDEWRIREHDAVEMGGGSLFMLILDFPVTLFLGDT